MSEVRLGEQALRFRANRVTDLLRTAREITMWQRDGSRRIQQMRRQVLADISLRDEELVEIYEAIVPPFRPQVVSWVSHRCAGRAMWQRALADWAHWPALVEWMCAHETARQMGELRRHVLENGSADSRCLLLEDASGEEAAALLDRLWSVNNGREISLHFGVYGLPSGWKEDRPVLAKLLSHQNAETRVQVMRFFGAEAQSEEEAAGRARRVAEWRQTFLDPGRLEQD